MSTPVVLWQSPAAKGRAAEDTRAQAEAAAELGCRVVPLPESLDDEAAVARAFAAVEAEPAPRVGLWVGFFPTPAVYRAAWAACAARNIALLNDPEAHLEALEMDRLCARLGALTPATAVVEARDLSAATLAAAAARVGGYPVFVKGGIKSRKESGWSACVAEDLDALVENARALLALPEVVTRGRVIVRALAPLKRTRVGDRDFLVAREFRAFVHAGEPLAWSFYWPYLMDEFWPLAPEEEAAMLEVARVAAARLAAPWISLDLGQREDGAWIVVEASDAQFSGLSLVDPRALWSRLVPRLDRL